ncbi:hypothetical protein V475_14865 [Sphingobium baderi LL03]|uniref:HPr-rel-A system PqqD family protein n=1 Tax=Sphingobium baderi LL03 TaxID=1114964 RepID=T0G5K5_9SPHN|nr:hypothetical protein L485_15575 [Sphingobium baderi LL03]KMS61214.1 hypothetical protein V475_14865 [Sphingobium baderi LL03]
MRYGGAAIIGGRAVTVDQRYCREGEGNILSRTLGDIGLLYHRPSGQTHIVISPVPEILEAMEDDSPVSVGDLLQRLSRRFDLGPQETALPKIAAHLADMAALGLIRAVA